MRISSRYTVGRVGNDCEESAVNRGYFGIGIVNGKKECNIGTLWRGAFQLGAAFIFTIGNRYSRQCSDTLKTWRHVPLFQYADFLSFLAARPYDCQRIAVETGGDSLFGFEHPQRAIYILGAEDNGLSEEVIARCDSCIAIPSVRVDSYNVAQAGTIVMYDRLVKNMREGQSKAAG